MTSTGATRISERTQTFEVQPLDGTERSERTQEGSGPILRAGGLVTQWCGEQTPPAGTHDLRGMFFGDHHDGLSPLVPATVGKVRSIAVATCRYTEVSPRNYARDPNRETTLRPVLESPSSFAGLGDLASNMSEDGMVVTIEVAADS